MRALCLCFCVVSVATASTLRGSRILRTQDRCTWGEHLSFGSTAFDKITKCTGSTISLFHFIKEAPKQAKQSLKRASKPLNFVKNALSLLQLVVGAKSEVGGMSISIEQLTND